MPMRMSRPAMTSTARSPRETADWVRREMQSPEGGYYSSLDADSEGHEGKFYVWSRDEVRAALTAEEYDVFAPRYGLDREPNFEGQWHLHVFRSLEDIAAALGRPREAVESLLDAAREQLLRSRERRIRPARDDKILASWNGLMIRGLAVAARALGRDDLADSATRALEFVRRTLWREGRLLATYNDGRAHLNAYLDDYAFLADAVLELQQVRFRADELRIRPRAAGGDAAALRRRERRRLLLHLGRSRAIDPPAEILRRRRHSRGQWCRGIRAAADGVPSGRGALPRGGGADDSCRMGRDGALPAGAHQPAHGSRGDVVSRRKSSCCAATRRRSRAGGASLRSSTPRGGWCSPCQPMRRTCRRRLQRRQPRGAAVAYVCRGNVCGEPIASFSDLTEALRA